MPDVRDGWRRLTTSTKRKPAKRRRRWTLGRILWAVARAAAGIALGYVAVSRLTRRTGQ
jgi:hypothetical protein